jgi:hypothetical protein
METMQQITAVPEQDLLPPEPQQFLRRGIIFQDVEIFIHHENKRWNRIQDFP